MARFLNVKNLDKDFNQNGGGSDADHPLSAFADFSISDEPIKIETPDDIAAQQAIADATKAKEALDITNKAAEEKAKLDIVTQAGNETAEDKLKREQAAIDLAKVNAEGNIEFKIPQSEEPKAENWGAVAKGLGFADEVKNFTEFKATYEKKISDLEKKAEDNKLVVDKESVYKQLDPEAATMMKYLDNGGSLQEYLKPGQEADQYLAMESEDLVKQDLIARGYTEGQASEKITRWMENGVLEDNADEIRHELRQAKAYKQQEVLSRQQEIVQFKEQQQLVKETNNTKAIEESLGKITNFMGGNITDDHRKHVMKEFSTGRSQEFFKDPAVVAEFLLFKTFGEQVLKTAKRQEFDKGKDRIQQQLSNIPPDLGNKGGRIDNNQQSANDKEGFGSWASAGEVLYTGK